MPTLAVAMHDVPAQVVRALIHESWNTTITLNASQLAGSALPKPFVGYYGKYRYHLIANVSQRA